MTVKFKVILLIAMMAPTLPAHVFSQNNLRKYLQDKLTDRVNRSDLTARYEFATVNLTAGGQKSVLVYITSNYFCGSGGCNLLVLQPEGKSFRMLSEITISRPPIRVLNHLTHGWHDIGVWVQGGGIQHGYEAALPFNGHTYAKNPTVPPAHKSRKGAPGKIVIPDSEGKPVF